MKKLFLGIISVIGLSGYAQMGIIGGAEAEAESYPWMCSIILDVPETGCGASLIRPQWVLTAGHCDLSEFGIGAESILINSTILDLDALAPYAELIDIEAFIVHEDYNPEEGFGPDIALIRLSEPSTITPVELATLSDVSYFEHGDPAMVLGWGTTLDGEGSDDLLFASCRFFGSEECGDKYDLSAYDPSMYDYNEGGNICAGYFEGEDPGGAAAGDSGGPLFFEDADGNYKQVGVVSGGESSITLEDFPGVFTLVPMYVDWIETTIADYETAAKVKEENRENLSLVYFAGRYVQIDGLSVQNDYDLAVYDSRGSVVVNQTIVDSNSKFDLNTSDFRVGMYMVRVLNKSNGKVTVEKFVVN